MSTDADDQDPSTDSLTPEEIIHEAKEFYKLVDEAEGSIRTEALDDLKFYIGEQWPADIKTQRIQDKRPVLVVNRLPQFVQQVTNDQRQNRPSIKVYPVDDDATIEIAKIMQGMIRHIEYNSNADVAYDTSFESAVKTGRGFFRIVTDYCDPMSFNQEILIKQIPNQFSVFFDPASTEPDGRDANRAMIVEVMPKSQFKEQYPDTVLSQMIDWETFGAGQEAWVEKDSCRVAEFFKRVWTKKHILLLSNGDSVVEENLNENPDFGEGVTIKDRRETLIPEIRWWKITSTDVLEEAIWPGEWIPIVPVYGNDERFAEKRILSGIIRQAKDPQRMLNYMKSNQAEVIALAPKAPFIGVAGQFEGFENIWRTANVKNHAYLEVKPIDVAGVPAPLPTRNTFEPPVGAITEAVNMSADDLKATTGIYDDSLGKQSNDTSGIAIQRRNSQSQTSNFHYMDNFTRSLRHAGRITQNLIPKIYDTNRIQRIVHEDGTQDVVEINAVEEIAKGGKNKKNDLSIGRYDVVVESGPSYATKRLEAAHSMENVLKAYPQLMNVMGDLFFKNLDWPGAEEMANRMKKTMDPKLLDNGTDQPQIPPQAQAQMQQMQNMILQLTQELKASQDIIDNKKLELGSKERIAQAKLQVDIEKILAQIQSSDAQTLLKHQLAAITEQNNQLLAAQPITPNPQPQNQNPMPGSNGVAAPGQSQPTGGIPPG